jgi:hypothetical protein
MLFAAMMLVCVRLNQVARTTPSHHGLSMNASQPALRTFQGRLPRCARGIAALALLSSSLARSVDAQRTASIVAGVRVERDSLALTRYARLSRTVSHAAPGRASRISHDALVGAGIGAATGLIASPIVNAQNSDHSEDGMTYVVLVSFGALVGLVAGSIIGWTRGP